MCKQYTIFNKKNHFANFGRKILYEFQEIQDQSGFLQVKVRRALEVDPEPLLPFLLLILVVIELVKLPGSVRDIRLQLPRIFQ